MLRIESVRLPQRGVFSVLAAAVVAGCAIALAAGVAIQVVYAERIFPGVTAAGVDLGGQTVAQATARLQPQLDAYQNQTVDVTAGDQHFQFTTRELGFLPRAQVLAQASFQEGRDGLAVFRLAGLAHASASKPPLAANWDVDEAAVARILAQVAARVDRPAVNPRVAIGTTVTLTPGRLGRRLESDASRMIVERQLADLRSGPLSLPVQNVQPAVDDAQADAIRSRAQGLLNNGVVIVQGQRQWRLPDDTLRSALGYQEVPPALTVDRRPLTAFVDTIARESDRPAVDARIVVANGKVQVTPDQDGQKVDVAATVDSLRAAIAVGRSSSSPIIRTLPPSTRQSALVDVARHLQASIDRGVTLAAGDVTYPIAGALLGDMVKVMPRKDGGADASLDATKLGAVIAMVNDRFKHPSLGTRFDWNDGRLSLLGSSRAGWIVDQPAALASVQAHWRDGVVELPVVESPTAIDDAYVARVSADLKGVLQDRSTSYAGSIPERAHNIALAAQHLNGALVPPGSVFSFNDTIGPTTLKAGYQWGFAFSTDSNGDWRTVPSVAGGLCQVASTVFQPVFWTGYEIEERHYHMFWIRRYADRGYLGVDATVSPADNVDFKFKNDTDHAVLIQSWTDADQQIHVRLIGTKPDWRVQVDPERISNVIPAPSTVIRSTSPLFARGRTIVLEEAQTGLTSEVVRHVVYPDGHQRSLQLKSVYQPANQAILVGTG